MTVFTQPGVIAHDPAGPQPDVSDSGWPFYAVQSASLPTVQAAVVTIPISAVLGHDPVAGGGGESTPKQYWSEG